MATLGLLKHVQSVTKSDTTALLHPSMYLSWTDATGGPGMGTVFIDTVGGEVNVGVTLPAGFYPIGATKVYSTNTTAANIVSYWDA